MELAVVHQQDELERAASRLLVWGFSPECIAEQLDCELQVVERIREELERSDTEVDDIVLHRLTAQRA